MKKNILLLFICICFISCYNSGTEHITKDNSTEGISGEVVVKEIIYKDHSYLEFRDRGLHGQGWVHNPDCECFNKKNNKVIIEDDKENSY
jgi:hypothetical protein